MQDKSRLLIVSLIVISLVLLAISLLVYSPITNKHASHSNHTIVFVSGTVAIRNQVAYPVAVNFKNQSDNKNFSTAVNDGSYLLQIPSGYVYEISLVITTLASQGTCPSGVLDLNTTSSSYTFDLTCI